LALVDGQGDIWVVSSESQQLDRIVHVLALRLENVQELGLDVPDMPPLAVQEAIQRALYEEWPRGPIGREIQGRWSNGSVDARTRNFANA
jgi:hypothetical protein